jgi:sugar lactone lactonase YvrE
MNHHSAQAQADAGRRSLAMKMAVVATILCAALIASVPSPGQESNDSGALNAEAIKAYRAKDYARFLAYEKRALELQPGNPRLIYNVACGESLQGNALEAVRLLDQLVARRLDLGAETDDDFSTIRKTPEWAGFESRLAELRKPLVRSQAAFHLADPGLVATGIAFDPRTGDTYIASARERKIVRRTRDGKVSDFISEAQDGFLGGDSLAVDSRRHLLFASTAAASFMVGYRKEDFGTSGVFVFDLKSGKLIRKALLPADGKRHILNAVVVDREGDAYVSDSSVAGIYRLRRGSGELEAFVPGNVFAATQGLALSSDDKTLYVADYTNGLWALDLASKNLRQIAAPADVWLAGLDGLSRIKDELIAVQIGVKPERVLRLRLDPRAQKISSIEVLEINHPDYSGPIQGTIAGQAFLYVANSQLNLVNDEAGTFAADRARATVVLRLPLADR